MQTFFQKFWTLAVVALTMSVTHVFSADIENSTSLPGTLFHNEDLEVSTCRVPRRGPHGERGRTGPTGPTGPCCTGAKGSTGATGPTGPCCTGSTGSTGPTGPCCTGSTGPTGPCCTGPTGPTGSVSTCFATFHAAVTPPTANLQLMLISTPPLSEENSGCVKTGYQVTLPGVYQISFAMSFGALPPNTFIGIFKSATAGQNPILSSIVFVNDGGPIVVSNTVITTLTTSDVITLQAISDVSAVPFILNTETISFVFLSP